MIYQSVVIGAEPSGKAAVFDTAILGSNPSAPATKICLIKVPISLKKLRGTFFHFIKIKN